MVKMKTETWSYTARIQWNSPHGLLGKVTVCLLTLFITSSICQEEYPPQQITEQPASGDPRQENLVKRLTCQASSYPTPVYSWIKDGVFVQENSTQNVYEISQLKRSDAGEYRCLAGNKLGAFLSQPAFVVVAYLESFPTGAPIDKVVVQGQAIVLDLPTLDSVPDPDVDWKENNTRLSSEDIYHHVTLKKNLVLLSTSSSYNHRQYQVRAINVFNGQQSESRIFKLSVTETGNPSSNIPPVIIVPPVETIANVGDSDVKVECVVNARPMNYLNIQWHKLGAGSRTEITRNGNPSKYNLTPFKRQLTIKNPQAGDSGLYECEASLSWPGGPTFPTATATANVTIRERPLITPNLPSSLDKDFSDRVDMTCTAIGSPEPSITWYYNGRKISTLSNPKYTTYENGTLVIENIDLPDAGVYQCMASNGAGEVSSSTWLKVNSSPPSFVTAPQDLTVVETNEARFPCTVTGAPKPDITWRKITQGTEETISSGGRFQILDNGLLLIATTEKADSAVYRCTATNIRGNATEQATLQVITKTQIIRPPQNVTAILSTSATLECGVSSDENIQVVWRWYFYKKPDYIEEEIISSGRRVITPQGSLIISGVAGQDIGRYKCQVISPGGNDSRIATLMVIELPRRPVIMSVVMDTEEENAVVITWKHEFDGNSAIQRYIVSYRDENPNGNNEDARWQVYPDRIPPKETSYHITNLKPARYYKFRISAVNGVGEGPSSIPKPDTPIQMPPQPPSAPPRNFYCSPQVDRAILVQWQAPDEGTWNGDLLGYNITYKVSNLPDTALNVVNVTNPASTQYKLSNLVYHQQYTVKIAAFNIKGTGVFSNEILVWTNEGRPTAPPRNVTLLSPNSTTILVTWLPPFPEEIFGVNQGYTIELRRASVTQAERGVFVPADPDNLYGIQKKLILDLRKFTEYVVTIVCRTTAGPGPTSSPVHVTTQEDVPGPVGNLHFDNIQDTTLRVSWTAPVEINGILEGYKLWHEKKNQSNTRQEVDLADSFTSYTIQKLSPSTKYYIAIAAKTGKGYGPTVSADIDSGVPPELPTAPYNLGFTNIQARSVLLQFLPGSNGKTSITLWIVEALEGDSATWREIYTKNNPDAREILVQNLRPYTKYRLRLIAENIVGRSNASAQTRSFETKQDAPDGPPGNVTVRALNSTAFRISWIPLPRQDWNGAPRGYKIYYRRKLSADSEFTVIPLENGMNMESFILSSLQEWMEYQVKMTSYNDVGVSDFSPVHIERTREAVPSASPTRVVAAASSSTSINVTWGPVPTLEQNGMIQGYKVKYSASSQGIAPQYKEVDGNETYFYVLRDLRKFVEYEVQVLAFTRMGDGILSPTSFAKTFEDYPGPPIIIYFPEVTYSSAKIVWNPPSEPNGIITKYKISYSKLNSDENVTVETEATVHEDTVFGLERETYYVFSVTAKTRFGYGETANVTVYTMNDRGRPDSPSQPTIGGSQVTARSVTISWSPGSDNYGPLRNFTIQYQSRNSDWVTLEDTVPPETSSHVVTRLRPNTWYKFRVSATNDVGTSDYSVPSAEVQTLSDKPEGEPRNLKVMAVTTSSINATWQQPEESTWNGPIVGYIVQYRQLQLPDYNEELVPFRDNSIVLRSLIMKVYYEVRVLAYNDIGQGPPSPPATIYVGEAAPTAAPSNVQAVPESSSQIQVSWKQPPPDTQNGGLSGYKVLYWKNGTGAESSETIIVVETQTLLRGLDTYSQYYLTVQAYNLAGDGPKSPVTSSRTKEGVPGPPMSLKFSNITLTKLTVSWLPPAAPNGQIRNYELVYFLKQENGGENKLVKLTLEGSQHQIVIDSLEETREYTFQISARTSVGMGTARNGTVTTGPQPGSPGPPSKPSLEEKDKSVILIWINGNEGQSPIYGYMIQAMPLSGEKYNTIMQKNSRDPTALVSFQNLTPNTQYRFRIIAINSNGISQPSEPSELKQTPGPGQTGAIASVGKPFHSEWWFLVIIALTGIIVLLIIVSLLCLVGRRSNSKKQMKRSATNTTVMSEPPEPEDGGFPSMEMPPTRRSMHIRNGAPKNIYARSPPRPSPASVTYSDDDIGAKAPIPDDESSLSEKQSIEDSEEPSDTDSEFDDSEKSPSSPPPPPFGSHYANNDVRQSWKYSNTHNAYAYTDSEAESNHYALSLTGGQIMNNRAGSRAPVTGFSSFV